MNNDQTMIEVLRSYINGEPENDFAHWDERIINGWVLDAREWLQNQASEPVLLPKQAFDGIVSLCQLHRSRPEVVRSLGAADDVLGLEMRLINEASGDTAALALSHPDVFGWKRLSEKLESMILDSWESTVPTGISLVRWLDSLDCLRWFVDQHDIRPEEWSESVQQQWASLCEQMDECSSWIIDNADCFFETEFYLERICHTFRGDLDSPEIDRSGSFAITVLRHISLLARMRELNAEEDQQETAIRRPMVSDLKVETSATDSAKVHPQRSLPFYTRKSFWKSGIPFAAAAAASAGVTSPSPPVVQFSHPVLSQLKASLVLPNELSIRGETQFRMSVRAEGPADSALLTQLRALDGQETRVGGASARLELKENGSDLRVVADLIFEDVWKTESDEIQCSILGVIWNPVGFEGRS
jgi:hypothetical protein